jgi:hypothetical protein
MTICRLASDPRLCGSVERSAPALIRLMDDPYAKIGWKSLTRDLLYFNLPFAFANWSARRWQMGPLSVGKGGKSCVLAGSPGNRHVLHAAAAGARATEE